MNTDPQLSLKEHQEIVLWAVDYAGQVMHLFEERYPDDHRPRNALFAARKWVEGELSAGEVRKYTFAAHSAAHDAEDKIATAVALCAGYAASTVQEPSYAPHVATYAMKALSISVSSENAGMYRRMQKKSELIDAMRQL